MLNESQVPMHINNDRTSVRRLKDTWVQPE
jgi:hypothetical protein